MGRKHNCKHPQRSPSNYALRLAKRGLSKSPVMESLETLRKRQKKDPEVLKPQAGWADDFVDMSGV